MQLERGFIGSWRLVIVPSLLVPWSNEAAGEEVGSDATALASSLHGAQRGQGACGAPGLPLPCALQGLFEKPGVLVHTLFESSDVKGLLHPCTHFIWILFSKKYFKLKRGKIRSACYWAGNAVMQHFHFHVSWLSGRRMKTSRCQIPHQNPTMEIHLDTGECWKAVGQISLHGPRLRESNLRAQHHEIMKEQFLPSD